MAKILSIYDKLKQKVDEAYDAPATPENRKKLAELLIRKHRMNRLFKERSSPCQEN